MEADDIWKRHRDRENDGDNSGTVSATRCVVDTLGWAVGGGHQNPSTLSTIDLAVLGGLLSPGACPAFWAQPNMIAMRENKIISCRHALKTAISTTQNVLHRLLEGGSD